MSSTTRPEQNFLNLLVVNELQRRKGDPVTAPELCEAIGCEMTALDLALKKAKRAGEAEYVRTLAFTDRKAGWVYKKPFGREDS